MESVTDKRARKKNFSDHEVRVIIEEVSIEGMWLLGKNNARVTNQKKEKKWLEIADRVSACGVSRRESAEVKEKFKKMRTDVLNRQREMKKTGGGKPPPPVPYEDLILQIIGAESNLINGIVGVDVPTDSTQLEEEDDCLFSPKPSCMNSTIIYCADDRNDRSIGHGLKSLSPVPIHETQQEMLPESDMRFEEDMFSQDGSIISTTMPKGASTSSCTVPVRPREPPPATPLHKRTKSSVNVRKELANIKKRRQQATNLSDVVPDTGAEDNQGTWNSYLHSEICKNESKVKMMDAKTLYYETLTKKLKMEMEKM